MMFATSSLPPDGNGIKVPDHQAHTVNFVSYDEEGRIKDTFKEALFFFHHRVNQGGRFVLGEASPSTHYVNFDKGVPMVRPRPALDAVFDKTVLAPGEAATLPDILPCEINFTGPVQGQQPHPERGPVEIGWTVPGEYTVTVTAFPYLPATFTLTVK